MSAKVLRIEIHAESAQGPGSLRKTLAPLLREAGILPGQCRVDWIGDPPIERHGAWQEPASYVVNELRIHLPAALIALGTKYAVEQTASRVKDWRRQTGNAGIDVEIWGPDGRLLKTIERDRDIHTEIQMPPTTPSSHDLD